MKIQKLYSYVRQALDDFSMIEEGDKIAIGISGGKDSLALLYALSGLRSFYPKSFSIVAITIDLGYENFELRDIAALCEKLEVEYHIVKTEISQMLKEGECSLCARLRKGAFNEKAKELGCNKIAYGHHMDDAIETLMLSLIYEGRFSSFWPVTYLDTMGLTLIRPMLYVSLTEIVGFQYKYALPVSKNPCPYEKQTQRNYVRGLLKEINHHAPGVKKRMLTSLMDGTIPEWVPKKR